MKCLVETVSLSEFRRHAEEIIQRGQRGKRLILTYKGKPVLRLEPIVSLADPFYRLTELAASAQSITNEEIDETLYETEQS